MYVILQFLHLQTGTFSQSRYFYPGCFAPSAGFVNVQYEHFLMAQGCLSVGDKGVDSTIILFLPQIVLWCEQFWKICTLHFFWFRKHWIPLHWRIVGFWWAIDWPYKMSLCFSVLLIQFSSIAGKDSAQVFRRHPEWVFESKRVHRQILQYHSDGGRGKCVCLNWESQ